MFRLLLGIALGIGISTPTGLWVATAIQLAVNAETGLAINGLDPAPIFTEGKALFARPEFELYLDGVVWSFSKW
ncbi:MAG TPA: hypothetical protein VI358_14090 [Pseudolabrys sp.]